LLEDTQTLSLLAAAIFFLQLLPWLFPVTFFSSAFFLLLPVAILARREDIAL
jgi:hypothetical protein